MAETSFPETPLAQLQRQLDAARAELQDFTYAVSHDLRAPLRHIKAYAQIMVEDWPDMPPDMAAHLGTIQQAAQLLASQIDGLTQLSRLNLQPLNLQPVNVSALARELADALDVPVPTASKPASQTTSLTPVQWQLATDVPLVLADAALLRQLLTQVLDNALKFSRCRAPAQIALTWQIVPAQAQADLGAGARACQITVSDNGVGFAPEQAKALFQVFGRLHPAREFDGLGLGLVQCRKIAQRLGGSVAIDAEVNAGCRVSVTLPLA